MTEQDKKQLGNTLWGIADQLRGAMNADDFRDYMLSFLFLRYLSDNYETAAQKELGIIRSWMPAIAAHLWRYGMRKTRTIPLNLKNRCAARCIM